MVDSIREEELGSDAQNHREIEGDYEWVLSELGIEIEKMMILRFQECWSCRFDESDQMEMGYEKKGDLVKLVVEFEKQRRWWKKIGYQFVMSWGRFELKEIS